MNTKPTFRSPRRTDSRPTRPAAHAAGPAVEPLEGRLFLDAAAPVPAGPEFRANQHTAGNQVNPSVAVDADGDFVVAWQSYNQGGQWEDVYARLYDRAGAPRGGEFLVNQHTDSSQGGPVVATGADGGFVVAWTSYNSPGGDNSDVYARVYDRDGVPRGGEFRVNQYTASSQEYPSVAADADGDFVVTWLGPDGSDVGAYARLYGRDGVPRGDEFLVNQITAGYQAPTAVAMDADGDFLVTWAEERIRVGYSQHARLFGSDGVPRGDQFPVAGTSSNGFVQTRAAMDADGDFVLAWDIDGSGEGVYARLYDRGGAARGEAFPVNQHTEGNQFWPAVAMDADGDFLVTWNDHDGSGAGVYARSFDAAGVPRGEAFRVNQHTAGDQIIPINQQPVAMGADGDFVVAWQSLNQDGSGWGVYARRYSAATPVLPGDVTGDGRVDVSDLGVLATNYGRQSGATRAQGDLDGDGDVDVADLGILATHYGQARTASSRAVAQAPARAAFRPRR